MNNVEAKFILQGYRPNGADASDATFSAALEQAKRDPGLGEWLAREQAFDRAMSAKLSQLPAPSGLRESILAGGRATVPQEPLRRWWSHPAFLAAASVAVLLGVGAGFWPKPAAANASFAEFALADARTGILHHGRHGAKAEALQAALGQPATRLSAQLAVDFADLRDSGCRTVQFNGHEVLEVCFEREGAWFHCYIARRADFPAFAAALSPVLAVRQGAAIAAWADASRLYAVVSPAGQSILEKLL
jgi:hypothetical protein